MIEDDGFVLAESGAILLYLAEKAGQLADPKTRATVTRWCFAALTTVEPVVAMIVLADFEKKTDDVTKERRASLVTTVLRQARRAGLLATYPRCEAYRRKCEARPAWARTVAAYEARLSAVPGAVERAAEAT